MYPATLLKTNLRTNPAVGDWLKSHQVFDATCKAGEACCNPATLACGVPSQDVTSSISQPISQFTSPTVEVSPLPNGTSTTSLSPSGAPTASSKGPIGYLPINPIYCPDWDYGTNSVPHSTQGINGHLTGSHNWTATQIGTGTRTQ